MDIHKLSQGRYRHATFWAIVASLIIVAVTAVLARAALNLKAAIVEKPDIAIHLLLPEQRITTTTLLREAELERDYLAETKDGPMFIKLQRDLGSGEWFVSEMEKLRIEPNSTGQ